MYNEIFREESGDVLEVRLDKRKEEKKINKEEIVLEVMV